MTRPDEAFVLEVAIFLHTTGAKKWHQMNPKAMQFATLENHTESGRKTMLAAVRALIKRYGLKPQPKRTKKASDK